MDLTPEQMENLKTLAKIFGGGALIGGAGRAAQGIGQLFGSKYEPAPPPKPLIVDLPVPHTPAPEPAASVAALPLAPGRPKAAAGSDLFTPEAMRYFAAPAVGVGGLAGGWALTNKLIQAARRRQAEKQLDAARKDFQEASLGRITELQGAPKLAADWRAAATGEGEPADPNVKRAAAALDALWARAKAANEPGFWDKTLGALFAPGTMFGQGGTNANALLSGTAMLGGGYLGYKSVRDAAAAKELKEKVRRLEDESAQAVPPPMVARMVPVGPGGVPIPSTPV